MAIRLSPTLSFYIGRNFLVGFLMLFGIFLMIILMFDIIELMRRASSKPNITFTLVLEMALLKLPHMGQQLFPFAALFGAMAVFWRLTRHHELVVTRAAGVSAWQFLFPVVTIALLLGVLKVTTLNPLAAVLLTRYERLESTEFKGEVSFLALSRSGIWLRQANQTGQSVIFATHVFQERTLVELKNVLVFIYEGDSKFLGRIDADSARLEDGFWHMKNARVSAPEQPTQFDKEYWLATDLTLDKIQDSFATPETMSFWALPEFIETLEKSGFSAVRHRLYWNSLMAAPLMICAMILIAATFTLRHSRRSGNTVVVAGGILTGFIVYFFQDIVFALGLSNNIPVVLAAWAPASIATLLGLAMLLHLEDG
jgi:lipopolysaccharide export system permease protein